ncbi:hypothetical protein EG329_010435 [Mollisiaceae sp. DMI_Dod_QoI]|nr:hypothetical protein EG329_010435 [Helotiales sp. DMI_Dod_QoI]
MSSPENNGNRALAGLRAMSRSFSETVQIPGSSHPPNINQTSVMDEHTPPGSPRDRTLDANLFIDDFPEDLAESTKETGTASFDETPAAPKPDAQHLSADHPVQLKQEPVTPPPTQSPEADPTSASSTEAPVGADVEMSNTPGAEEVLVKEEPEIKLEPADISNVAIIDLTDDRGDEEARPIDLTDDDDIEIIQKSSTAPDQNAELNAIIDPVPEEMGLSSQLSAESEELPLFVPESTPEADVSFTHEPIEHREDVNFESPSPERQQQEDAQQVNDDSRSDTSNEEDNAEDDLRHALDQDRAQLPFPLVHSSAQAPKLCQQRGPKAKTAREWHHNRQAKMTPAQLRGPAWKQEQLDKLQDRVKAGTRKRKAPKPTKQPARKVIDPRVFLEGGVKDQVRQRRSTGDEGSRPQNSSTTKKHWWKIFKEQNHGIDLHKCTRDKNELLDKSRSFGYKRMQPSGDSKWQLKGMPTTLLPYQLVGVAFLTERECSVEGPWGSMCCDEMGMGKTIQLIALLHANPPTPEHILQNKKTTLIIVPSGIIYQWLYELKRHAGELGDSVMLYESSNKDNSAKRLKSNDIVLASYRELFISLPQPDKETIKSWVKAKPKVNLSQKLREWVELHKHEKGLLHQIDWYRIVLDEGHFIKNYLSRTSRAAVDLQGDYRLILSGTPIMNSYEEFYPLLCFLREPLTSHLDHEEFKDQFCGEADDEEAVKALSILISDLIIHRKMNDTFLDKPIIDLPQDHRSVAELDAQQPELILTGAFERRLLEFTVQTFGENDERRQLKHPFARLTRMRQLTANPDLISRQIIVAFSAAELETLRATIGKLKTSRSKKDLAYMLQSRLKIWIQEKKSRVYENAALEDVDEIVCMRCKIPSIDLWTLKKCKHIFCDPCLQECAIRDIEEDVEVLLCPKCGNSFKPKQIEQLQIPSPTEKAISKGVNSAIWKGKDIRKFRPSPAPNQLCFSRWLKNIDNRKIDLLPCAKLIGIRDQVREWLKKAPGDKIIIFTQFRHFQTMIGCALEQLNIQFIYFSGDMSADRRETAKEIFRQNGSVNVMIAGLKCGGLGLNLAFANRVIVADMWWNTCIDNQAFGRVFRMPQEKETHYVKMSINNTIDQELLLVLQRKKEKAYNKVMQDDLTPEEWDDIFRGSNETFEEYIVRVGAEIQPDYSGATGDGIIDVEDSDSN